MITRLMLFVIMAMTVGCAAKGTSVVLLENPDGTLGQVLVSNDIGQQTLDGARQSTSATATQAPKEPRVLEQQEIERDFGQALQSLPEAPLSFLLYFETGTSILTHESQQMPARILEAIAGRRSNDIRVIGHSDRVGAMDVNARLSLERAMTVRDTLIRAGVDERMIQVFSHGEGNPLIPTADEVPEPLNRRVEVLVR